MVMITTTSKLTLTTNSTIQIIGGHWINLLMDFSKIKYNKVIIMYEIRRGLTSKQSTTIMRCLYTFNMNATLYTN